MCDWDYESKKMARKLAGATVEQSFPREFIEHLSPETVTPGHCLGCGTKLSQSEMFPPGRAARYMCKACYESAAYGDPYHCLWCGRQLPPHQANTRRNDPRELKHAFCSGDCLDYHKVLAGIVIGIQFNISRQQPTQLVWNATDRNDDWQNNAPLRIRHNPRQLSFQQRSNPSRANNGVKYLPFPKPRRD